MAQGVAIALLLVSDMSAYIRSVTEIFSLRCILLELYESRRSRTCVHHLNRTMTMLSEAAKYHCGQRAKCWSICRRTHPVNCFLNNFPKEKNTIHQLCNQIQPVCTLWCFWQGLLHTAPYLQHRQRRKCAPLHLSNHPSVCVCVCKPSLSPDNRPPQQFVQTENK